MKKKKSLWNIFLIPILIIVFVQGAVPFLTLIFSGIRSNMENAVIGLDSHTVENRKVVLENDMIEQWSSVNKESDNLSSCADKGIEQSSDGHAGLHGLRESPGGISGNGFLRYGGGFAVQFHFWNFSGSGK